MLHPLTGTIGTIWVCQDLKCTSFSEHVVHHTNDVSLSSKPNTSQRSEQFVAPPLNAEGLYKIDKEPDPWAERADRAKKETLWYDLQSKITQAQQKLPELKRLPDKKAYCDLLDSICMWEREQINLPTPGDVDETSNTLVAGTAPPPVQNTAQVGADKQTSKRKRTVGNSKTKDLTTSDPNHDEPAAKKTKATTTKATTTKATTTKAKTTKAKTTKATTKNPAEEASTTPAPGSPGDIPPYQPPPGVGRAGTKFTEKKTRKDLTIPAHHGKSKIY